MRDNSGRSSTRCSPSARCARPTSKQQEDTCGARLSCGWWIHDPCSKVKPYSWVGEIASRAHNAECIYHDLSLDDDALDLIQADGIVGAIIELGRARGFVVSYLLRMLNCTTVLQIGGDAM